MAGAGVVPRVVSFQSAPAPALLRWPKPGRGGPTRSDGYQITRASSVNASASRAKGGTSVPRSLKPRRRFWMKAWPATMCVAVRSRF
jgi:hypothetical protein